MHVVGLGIVLMIAGLLTWPGAADTAQASVAPGRPCSTVGKTIVKPKWTFTCKVRKGAKVWVRTPRPAWERVAEELVKRVRERATPVPAGAFEVSASPTVSRAVVAAVTESVRWSYEPWQGVAPLPAAYPVAIVDRGAREWYADFSKRFRGDNCGQGWWERTERHPDQFHAAVCSGAGESWGYLVVYVREGATGISDFLALHESVHIAQSILVSEPTFNRHAECWLGEGMAELYTGALLSSRKSDRAVLSATRFYRQMVVGNLRLLGASAREVSDQTYWLDVIRRSESRGSDLCIRFGLGYSLGYLVTEKLVADFGENSLLAWMGETRVSSDPDASFRAVFGMDQDRWYERSAAPYVAREASKLLVD